MLNSFCYRSLRQTGYLDGGSHEGIHNTRNLHEQSCEHIFVRWMAYILSPKISEVAWRRCTSGVTQLEKKETGKFGGSQRGRGRD